VTERSRVQVLEIASCVKNRVRLRIKHQNGGIRAALFSIPLTALSSFEESFQFFIFLFFIIGYAAKVFFFNHDYYILYI